jgi:hypothetical protein
MDITILGMKCRRTRPSTLVVWTATAIWTRGEHLQRKVVMLKLAQGAEDRDEMTMT